VGGKTKRVERGMAIMAVLAGGFWLSWSQKNNVVFFTYSETFSDFLYIKE
jgi:hypothetical protein